MTDLAGNFTSFSVTDFFLRC